MAHVTIAEASDAPNHPLALRMGVIAGVCFNVVIGTVMGSFSVMLASAQERLHVPLHQAAVGMLLVLIGSSLTAPFVGVLMAKFPLRRMMQFGALLTTAGFLALAFTHSYTVYLGVYGLCFGPAMTLTGSVGPNTLVTRWFNQRRGLAVGLVNLAILIAIMPERLKVFVDYAGSDAAYLLLAGLCGLIMLPLTLFIQDYPPDHRPAAVAVEAGAGEAAAAARTADGSLSMGQLLRQPKLWALCVATSASMTSSILLGSLLIPIGTSWHYTAYQAAVLASIMSLIGIAGGILFGWVADRIGGARTLALVGFDCMVLWLALLLHPPFAGTAVVIGLIGLHGAAAMPALARALSDAFGAASYSRGLGLNTLISLPFSMIAILGSSLLLQKTGSFSLAMQAMAGLFLVGCLCGLFAARTGGSGHAGRAAASLA
ncbi:MAG: MFS transporter [Sphingomonadales bacterium]|nr:MFS transporter [Sphingomonadales bacterium]